MKGPAMQSTYSWCGSPLHLVLEDDLAEAYNRAIDGFFEAQKVHLERTGRKWQPSEPIWMNWSPEERDAYAKVGRVINLLIEINGSGLDIPEEQITSDYLVKV
jgi:hypothetical protein